MDGSLARRVQLWLTALSLMSLCASPVAAQCNNIPLFWAEHGDPAIIPCTLSSHYWWRGSDCDFENFERYGVNTNGCADGGINCFVPLDRFNRENTTVICCAENGETRLENAVQRECHQIAVCPSIEIEAPPPIVETGRTATVYVKVTTKPYPPPTLRAIDLEVEGTGIRINYSTSHIPPVEQTSQSLVSYYVYDFQVSLDDVQGSMNTLKVVPNLSVIPYDSWTCSTPQAQTITGIPIRVNPNPVSTTTPTLGTTANPTCPGVTCPTVETEGLTSTDCRIQLHHIGWAVGGSFAGGLLITLLVMSLVVYCHVKVRNSTGDHFPQKRPLPAAPGPVVPFQFGPIPRSRASDTGSHISNSTHTPTPTDSQRLLAGQTPCGAPPLDNHALHPQPIPPYASCTEMRTMSMQNGGSPLSSLAVKDVVMIQSSGKPSSFSVGGSPLDCKGFLTEVPYNPGIISTRPLSEVPGSSLTQTPIHNVLMTENGIHNQRYSPDYANQGDRMTMPNREPVKSTECEEVVV